MMKLALFLLSVAGTLASPLRQGAAKLSPVIRNGTTLLVDGKAWKMVGPNVYWLGLDENVTPPAGEPFYAPTKASYPTKERITEVMATVQALGGTMIRGHTLGVSTGNPLSVWPEARVVNEQAFDSIDWAVYQAGVYGIRLLVPLVDNYDYYHGGKYNFLRWGGFDLNKNRDENNPLVQQFYTNSTIIDLFKDYIKTIITHRNQYTNLTFAEDPTIFAYETGNELLGPTWGDMNSPADWVQEIAQYVKSIAPQKLVVDGTYGINKTHLNIEEVDIFSDHMYPVNTTKLQEDIGLVEAAGRPFFAGEYDWVGGDTANLQSMFKIIEESPAVAGDTFWSQFGHNAPDCANYVYHSDGLSLQYGNPRNTPNQNSRIQLIRKHFIAMSQGKEIAPDEALPAVPCPAPTSPSRR
ncbi:glycoside hydrolase family 5 protein [Hypoxylon rubiginosum]|uniref:Glycoside hydrolase family 5 protein n=1 Tax=Hypoxylon rubiginosum TaxID=110542 RepID=A0ACC0DMB6_9PEZI|nr:glycoside hydrolase family 5 protein [Hypoxylon rubiginosum]